jgi:hypothetical protein
MTESRVEVVVFNELPPEDAGKLLEPACASAAWQRVLVAGRPFGSPAEIAATSDGVIGALGWSDLQEALTGDPHSGGDVVEPRDDVDGEAGQQLVRRELAAVVRLRLAKTFR